MAEVSSLNHHPNCTICMQIFIKPTVLKCGHTFCYDCLHQWLGLWRYCPLCRNSVARRFRPIQLQGWDDTLENLAQQLPREQWEERRATKRKREQDGKPKGAKRTRNTGGADVNLSPS